MTSNLPVLQAQARIAVIDLLLRQQLHPDTREQLLRRRRLLLFASPDSHG